MWDVCAGREFRVFPNNHPGPSMCLYPHYFVSIIQSSTLQVLDLITVTLIVYIICPMVTSLYSWMAKWPWLPKALPIGRTSLSTVFHCHLSEAMVSFCYDLGVLRLSSIETERGQGWCREHSEQAHAWAQGK